MNEAQQQRIDARELQERAIRWVVDRQVAESWTEQDQNELDIWLKTSPAHLVAYWWAKDSWNRTELLGALRSLRPPRPKKTPVAMDATRSRRRGSSAYWCCGHVIFLPTNRKEIRHCCGQSADAFARRWFANRDEHRDGLAHSHVPPISGRSPWNAAKPTSTSSMMGKHPFVVKVGNNRLSTSARNFPYVRDGPRTHVSLVEGLARIDNLSAGAQTRSTLLRPGDVAVATALSVRVLQGIPASTCQSIGLAARNSCLRKHRARRRCRGVQSLQRQEDYYHRSGCRAPHNYGASFQANDLEACKPNIASEVFKLRVAQRSVDEILISH